MDNWKIDLLRAWQALELKAADSEAAQVSRAIAAKRQQAVKAKAARKAAGAAKEAARAAARLARKAARLNASGKEVAVSTTPSAKAQPVSFNYEALREMALEALKDDFSPESFQFFSVKSGEDIRSIRRKVMERVIREVEASDLPRGLKALFNGRYSRAIAILETFRLFPGLGKMVETVFAAGEVAEETLSVYSVHRDEAVGFEGFQKLFKQLYGFKLVWAPKESKAAVRLGNRKAFKPATVTADDVANLAILSGADYPAEEGFAIHGQMFSQDDAGQWVMNGRKAVRPIVVVTPEGPVKLNSQQAAMLALLLGLSAVNPSEGETAQRAQFRRVLDRSASKLFGSPEYGFIDGRRQELLDTSVQVMPLDFGADTLFADTSFACWTQGLLVREADKVTMDRQLRKLMPSLRVRAQSDRYAPAGEELGNEEVAVPSTDMAKAAKRTDMDACAQLEPVIPSLSSVSYRGMRSTGTLIQVMLAPCGIPTIFGGGPGGSVALIHNFGDVVPVLDRKTFTGTSFGIRTEEDRLAFEESLPKVGEELGAVLAVHGAPSIRVHHSERGTVTKVTKPVDGEYRNIRWQVATQIVDRDGWVKLRGGIKTMVTKTTVAKIRKGVLLHSDIRNSSLALSGYDGEALLASMDAFKGTGKGNARFRVEISVETIRFYLPEVEAEALLRQLLPETVFDSEGNVEYRESWDTLGFYEPLVHEFEKRFAKTVWAARTLTQGLFQDLLEAYANRAGVTNLEWTSFTERGIAGKAVIFEIGEGITKEPELLAFYAYEDGVFAVAQKTTAFKTAMLVKAEYVGVRDMASKARLMLENAYAARAMGLPLLAADIEATGRDAARGVLTLIRLVRGVPTKGNRVIEASKPSAEDLETIQEILQSDLMEWPANVSIQTNVNGRWLTLESALLSVISEENPQFKAIKGVLEAILRRDRVRFDNNVRVLASGLKSMIDLDKKGLWKKLHAGAPALSVKRVPIFGGTDNIHEEIHVNPRGKAAQILARLFGVSKVRELGGRMVVVSRAPMFLPVPLRIVFSDLVGPYVVGLSDRVMSIDNGDADGDTCMVYPIKSKEVEDELQGFDAWMLAKRIHASTHICNPFHWVDQNLLVDGKHNRWAKAKVVSVAEIAALDEGTIEAYRKQMPEDANRAHLALAIASMGLPVDWSEFTVEDANGLMFSVYEAELGGYDKNFAAAHGLFKTHETEGLKAIAEKLDLQEKFSEVWLKAVKAKAAAARCARSGELRKTETGESKMVFKNITAPGLKQQDRFAGVYQTLALAMKLLAQGNLKPALMLNLDRARIENWTWQYEEQADGSSKRKLIPILSASGETESVDLAEGIIKLSEKKVPAAIRLHYWMKAVLPELRAHHANELVSNDEMPEADEPDEI